MSTRPLNDRVLIKRRDSETKAVSGIFIPDSAGEKPEQGEVLAVDPGKMLDNGARQALSLKAGEAVRIGEATGRLQSPRISIEGCPQPLPATTPTRAHDDDSPGLKAQSR